MKRFQKAIAAGLAGMMLLTACSGGGTSTGGSTEAPQLSALQFPDEYVNEEPAIEGGVLKVGVVAASPFQGMFNSQLYEDAVDGNIMQPTMLGQGMVDEDFKIREGGGLFYEVDKDTKTVKIKLHEKLTWNDGTPVTSKDIIYTYKFIGHPDYTGVRFDSGMRNVVGMEEYHDKKAEEISGLKVIDDKTVEVTFKTASPSMLWGGQGLPFNFLPAHQMENIPVKDMESSDASRKTPLSYGPYYITNIIPGEKVEFAANEHFWNGKPKIPKITMEVVSPDVVAEAMKIGKFDILTGGFPTSNYDQIKDLNNIKILGSPERSYAYIGFKLGKWDITKNEVVTDPNAKMADPVLRKAMGHALDMKSLGEQLYFGLRGAADSYFVPVFKKLYNHHPNAILFDKDKAMKLLDDAGYKDVDGDGFREKPDGSKLEINVATMAGGDIGDNLALFYTQSWEAIGLNAKLTTGRPIEFNAFYDKVQADDPEIDVFMAAWSVGSNPDPNEFFARTAQFNFSRFASDELDQILSDISSEKAFDDQFRLDAYKRFEDYMFEQVPMIPIQFRTSVIVVNNRVKNYDVKLPDSSRPYTGWGDLELTAEEPYVHQG
ncbi:MAG: oligopeptide ABC transporter substrate-binding protein [Peptostreptococcaceae bacterium]|nr:oligopeptide ABC transporter substrate-binding protein [Peptostreptococcaceae bacterium]